MKILYIHKKIELVNGGSLCQAANLYVLRKIAGYANVINFTKDIKREHKFTRNINRLLIGRYANFKSKDIGTILEIIECNKIDVVFFDGSQMGLVAKEIKKKFPSIKIFSFFHNIELKLKKYEIKNLTLYQYILAQLDLLNIYIGEKNTCKYSDVVLCLNKRDADIMRIEYKRFPDIIVPISLNDHFNPSYLKQHNNKTPIGLMVGSYFPPNIEGLDWFVSNVLPYVNIDLIVAGSGMDILIEKYKHHKNIKIYGYVEDLNELYAKADFMIMPIFKGSGMKVKTAEALSYGKYIIAAPEATVGYTFSNKEINVCNNSDDFIRAINDFHMPPSWNGYIESSREIYLEKYSYNSLERLYRKVF